MQRHRAVRTAHSRRRRPVGVVDEIVSVVELAHLDGIRLQRNEVAEILSLLSTELERPLPDRVLRATTSTALHDSLMDWQAVLLHEAMPERMLLQDADDEASADGTSGCYAIPA